MAAHDEFKIWILVLCDKADLPLFQKAVQGNRQVASNYVAQKLQKGGEEDPNVEAPWLRRLNLVMILPSGYKKKTPCYTCSYLISTQIRTGFLQSDGNTSHQRGLLLFQFKLHF